jgi:hypothetical protein
MEKKFMTEDEAYVIYDRFLLTNDNNDNNGEYKQLLSDINRMHNDYFLYKQWLNDSNKYHSLVIDNLPRDIKDKLIAIAVQEEYETNIEIYYNFWKSYIKVLQVKLKIKLKIKLKEEQIHDYFYDHFYESFERFDKFMFDNAKLLFSREEDDKKDENNDIFISSFNYTRYMKSLKLIFENNNITRGEFMRQKIDDYIYRQWLIKLRENKYIDNVVINRHLVKIVFEYL